MRTNCCKTSEEQKQKGQRRDTHDNSHTKNYQNSTRNYYIYSKDL